MVVCKRGSPLVGNILLLLRFFFVVQLLLEIDLNLHLETANLTQQGQVEELGVKLQNLGLRLRGKQHARLALGLDLRIECDFFWLLPEHDQLLKVHEALLRLKSLRLRSSHEWLHCAATLLLLLLFHPHLVRHVRLELGLAQEHLQI